MPIPKVPSRSYLYLLSFLEGGAVMICELVGAKMLAPFFGTSLHIWAAVLGLTLGGLTLGYFFGGRLSKRFMGDSRLLYWVLIAAGLFLVLMPLSSQVIMEATINMNLQTGAIISLSVFMVPPLICMGMVSPIIINLLTTAAGSAGNNAGNVYAISTLGGILFTFLMGFYIIPTFGISTPVVIAGSALALLPAILLLQAKQYLSTFCLAALFGLSAWTYSSPPSYPENYNVLYESEGILGQVKVVDHPSYGITEDARMGRGLIVNNTLQTYAGIAYDLQYSIWTWANYFPTAASIYPKGSKVLLLGLGGGTIVKQFGRLGFEVDVVEIDKRIWDVSVDFFNMDPATNVVIDDARHYIKTTDKKYDIVVFDTFLSESVPEHLLTMEGFADTRRILAADGMIMANFYGFIDGEKGKAARSVYKTFIESGFATEILATPGEAESRNLIFLASNKKKDFSKTAKYVEPGLPEINNLYHHILDSNTIDVDDVEVLTDHRPRLSKLYAAAAMSWKKSYNQYYREHFFGKE